MIHTTSTCQQKGKNHKVIQLMGVHLSFFKMSSLNINRAPHLTAVSYRRHSPLALFGVDWQRLAHACIERPTHTLGLQSAVRSLCNRHSKKSMGPSMQTIIMNEAKALSVLICPWIFHTKNKNLACPHCPGDPYVSVPQIGSRQVGEASNPSKPYHDDRLARDATWPMWALSSTCLFPGSKEEARLAREGRRVATYICTYYVHSYICRGTWQSLGKGELCMYDGKGPMHTSPPRSRGVSPWPNSRV